MARAPVRFWSSTTCKMTYYFSGIIFVFLTVFFQSVEPCLPRSIQASVPRVVMVGHVISRVNLDGCGTARLTSDDPRFSIQTDGSVVARQFIRVPPEGRRFPVWFQDQNGLRRKMAVDLSPRAREVGLREQRSGSHRRFKRRWSPPPFIIPENDRPPFPKDLDLIGSDTSQNYSLYYVISGPGVTEYPEGVFSVVRLTGMLKVHKPVDREQFPVFKFRARAINQQTHVDTDEPLIVTVNVQDVNDNAPQFSGPLQFAVPEKSPGGTEIGTVLATDADDPETDHTKIRYTLLSGTDLFNINPTSGLITTRTATLDREAKDTHLVTVEIKDKNGDITGLATTGTATISLKDINDNPPTFKSKVHSAKVKENEGGALILRIPVEDKDLEKTPNWKAVFKIVNGNENGNFRIETDPVTNEGLLYVAKPLDYEKNKQVTLKVRAENEAPLAGTTDTWATAPVDVTVENVDEGPEFVPPVLVRWIKENVANGTVIGTYTAIDPETSSSAGMRYEKVSDPASWITVDGKTGDLKIANTVDRESEFVQNGMYNITVKAIDASSKSGTGTVIIHVQDENDNVPKPVGTELLICEKKGQLGSVLVAAEDKDQKPFSDPFTFNLPQGNDGKWTITRVDGKSAMLQQAKELPTGNYKVPVVIKDQQSSGGVQTITVRVCQCVNGKCPDPLKSSALGVWGILALLFGLALLLLLAVCCAMRCSNKAEKFEMVDGMDGGGMLLTSNTEAPGDAVMPDVMPMPISANDQSVKGSLMGGSHAELGGFSGTGIQLPYSPEEYGPILTYPGHIEKNVMTENRNSFGRSIYRAGGSSSHLVDGHGHGQGHGHNFMDPSSLSTWNTNGMTIRQKLDFFRTEEDGRYADDLLHSYGFEGEGSPAGSVGCCSEQGGEEGLEFLDNLGPKFRNLAEVCRKK
ncbi:desmocollin 2-like protein [Anguilla rostrata]|uniref:desmocollin 2-like protein n=1 Tax=Anguilla rostrata TaxID=7938 RepID=UPI0030CC404B